MKWDLFISHASQDKAEFVQPLAYRLRKIGIKIWYDEFNIKAGDSLKESIENGIQHSKYGIVILSENFFKKEWTKLELNALFSKETIYSEKTIIPIWLDISKKEIFEHSPFMADKLAITASRNSDIGYVAEQILETIFPVKYKKSEIIDKISGLKRVKNRYRLKVLSDQIVSRISQLVNCSNEETERIIFSDEEWDDDKVNEIQNDLLNFYDIPIGVSFDNGGAIIYSRQEEYFKRQLKKWIKGKLSEGECWDLFNSFFMDRDFDYKYIFYDLEDEFLPPEPDEKYYQEMIVEIGNRNFA